MSYFFQPYEVQHLIRLPWHVLGLSGLTRRKTGMGVGMQETVLIFLLLYFPHKHILCSTSSTIRLRVHVVTTMRYYSCTSFYTSVHWASSERKMKECEVIRKKMESRGTVDNRHRCYGVICCFSYYLTLLEEALSTQPIRCNFV